MYEIIRKFCELYTLNFNTALPIILILAILPSNINKTPSLMHFCLILLLSYGQRIHSMQYTKQYFSIMSKQLHCEAQEKVDNKQTNKL